MMSTPRKRDHDEGAAGESPKRLRGGGGVGRGEPSADDLYDEDDLYHDAMATMADDVRDGPPPPEDDDNVALGEDVSDAHRARWARPAVPPSVWKTDEEDLNLQWLDIDMIGGSPLAENPNASKGRKLPGARGGTVPVIRLYGVNETGNSVAAFIHGFTPYGYFALPRGYAVDDSDEELGRIRNALDERLRAKMGSQFNKGGGSGGSGGGECQACLGVKYIKDKKSIMGYDPAHTSFLMVYVAMPGMIPKLRSIMEDGVSLTGIRDADGELTRETMIFQPFECNVPYVLRYMIDQEVTGASWLTLPKGTYRLRKSESEKGTHCQVRTVECEADASRASHRVLCFAGSMPSQLFLLCPARSKPTSASTRSLPASPWGSGPRWPPSASSRSTSSVRGARDTSPRRSTTPSSRSRTASACTAKARDRSSRTCLL